MTRINRLKKAILDYLGANGRHYGDLSRAEQSVEDLAQALNTRLDQLTLWVESGCKETTAQITPTARLAEAFLNMGAQLSRGGRVDSETADGFLSALDLLDLSADYRRAAGSAEDHAKTALVKDKLNRGA